MMRLILTNNYRAAETQSAEGSKNREEINFIAAGGRISSPTFCFQRKNECLLSGNLGINEGYV